MYPKIPAVVKIGQLKLTQINYPTLIKYCNVTMTTKFTEEQEILYFKIEGISSSTVYKAKSELDDYFQLIGTKLKFLKLCFTWIVIVVILKSV